MTTIQRPSSILSLLAGALALCTGFATAAGSATQPASMCNRSCWAARSPSSTATQMGSLNRAVIHHTANASDFNTTSQAASKPMVRAIQNLHMDVNGWSDIGYHFLVDKLGNCFEGRAGSLTSLPRGAHDSVNLNSFGFNVMGYFHTPHNQTPTTTQRQTLYQLIAWRMPNPFTGLGSGTYNGSTTGFVAGHRNVIGTACPGDLMYQFIGTNYSGGEARLGINGYINPAPAVEVIVDNTTAGGFTASSNWTVSASTGYYGTNSMVRPTASISDSATWTANLPSAGTYTVSARWVAGTNRAASAPYQVVHTGGTATVNKNQQANGSSWQTLGTYNFNAGGNYVRLSCWTTAGFYVSADAVRFVKQ